MTEQQDTPAPPNRSSRSARFFSHVHRYKNLLRKRWWVLPLAVTLAVAVQGFRIWRTPPTFVSVGRMIVNIKLQIPSGSVYMEEVNNFLGTQMELMRSGTVLTRAEARVRALKPTLAPCPVKLQTAISPKAAIFNLAAVGSEPAYTQAFLDACMDEFLALKKEMRASTSDTTLAGIQSELARLEKELRQGDEELLNFQSSNSVVVLQDQGGSASSYLAKLNSRLAELKTEQQLLRLLNLDQSLELQQKKAAAPSDESSTNATSLVNSGDDYLRAKQQISVLKAQQKELSEFLRPKHPKMVSLTEDISRKEKLLEIFRQQSLEQLDNRLKSLELQMQHLAGEITEWEVKSLQVSRKMAEYQRIRTNNERIKSLYDRLLATMQTLGVGKDIDPETVAPMERASEALPQQPDLVRALLIGALVGLVLGIGILFFVDRFDDRATSYTELQDLFDEPILGQIPQETSGKNSASRLLQPDDPRHAFAEAYRNLRSSLLYMATAGRRPKTLLVTSAIPGDGKSVTTANLAITLAQSGSRVLLVDGDLRKGVLHQQFNVPASPGLSEALSQNGKWPQHAAQTATANLFLLPRGAIAKNPGELFLSAATKRFLEEAAAQFDFVVIDTAPVMAADDVTSLAPHVEGVIFVVRSGCTSARVARAALELLYQREVTVLGLVFNGVETSASEYYFYKYKDYYATFPSA